MELVFRVLNDMDILCNPVNNGIASKKVLYDLTKTYLESIDDTFLKSLSKKEQELYIKDNISKYIITHNTNLSKKFLKRNIEIRNVINSFILNKDKESYYLLLCFLSTLNNHLVNGSKVYTEWISTTTNFDSMFKYYDEQDEHKVAVMVVPTNGVYNESTLAVDVSSKERIKEIRCLSKKINKIDVKKFIEIINSDLELEKVANQLFHQFIFRRTNEKFMGYNFSTASHEICLYNYLEPKYIAAVLEQLQIDLIRADRFNNDYLSYSITEQKQMLIDLKNKLRKIVLTSNDSFIIYVFEQLYLKNKNISLLARDKLEKEKIIKIRNKIISKALVINSPIIKK